VYHLHESVRSSKACLQEDLVVHTKWVKKKGGGRIAVYKYLDALGCFCVLALYTLP
jgi:hypothetical protein